MIAENGLNIKITKRSERRLRKEINMTSTEILRSMKPNADTIWKGCAEWRALIRNTTANGELHLSADGTNKLYKLLMDMNDFLYEEELTTEEVPPSKYMF